SNGADPLRHHGTRPRPTLTADDHPSNAPQVQRGYGAEKRLHTKESNEGFHAAKLVDPLDVSFALDADPHPYVVGNAKRRGELRHARGALREDLELVLGGAPHHVKDARDVLVGHVLVKEIGHAVHEDAPTRTPFERELEGVGHESKIEP